MAKASGKSGGSKAIQAQVRQSGKGFGSFVSGRNMGGKKAGK